MCSTERTGGFPLIPNIASHKPHVSRWSSALSHLPEFFSLRRLIGLHRLSDRRKRGIGICDFDNQPGITLVGEADGDGFVRVVDIAEHPLSGAEKASGLDYPGKISSWGSQRLP